MSRARRRLPAIGLDGFLNRSTVGSLTGEVAVFTVFVASHHVSLAVYANHGTLNVVSTLDGEIFLLSHGVSPLNVACQASWLRGS